MSPASLERREGLAREGSDRILERDDQVDRLAPDRRCELRGRCLELEVSGNNDRCVRFGARDVGARAARAVGAARSARLAVRAAGALGRATSAEHIPWHSPWHVAVPGMYEHLPLHLPVHIAPA